jgi:hypothetical protein
VDRVSRHALWVRALLVGSIAAFLGIAGHVMADGLLPGPAVLLPVVGFSVLMSVPVLNRRATPARLALLLVTGQTVIHLCLSLTAGHVGDPARSTGGARVDRAARGLEGLPLVGDQRLGSLQDAYATAADRSVGSPTLPIGHLIEDLSAHAPMMVAHLLAAALVGLWLAQGERYLWALVDLLGEAVALVLRRCSPLPPLAQRACRVVSDDAEAGFRSVWLALPRSRRGPPLPPCTA